MKITTKRGPGVLILCLGACLSGGCQSASVQETIDPYVAVCSYYIQTFETQDGATSSNTEEVHRVLHELGVHDYVEKGDLYQHVKVRSSVAHRVRTALLTDQRLQGRDINVFLFFPAGTGMQIQNGVQLEYRP